MVLNANGYRHALTLLVATAMLSSCATGDLSGSGGSQGEARAEREARADRHADAAGTYIGIASNAVGDEQTRLTLLAIEQWLFAGDTRMPLSCAARNKR